MSQHTEEEVQQAIKHIKDNDCDQLCWASHWVASALLEAREKINEYEQYICGYHNHVACHECSKEEYSKVKDLERKLEIAINALKISLNHVGVVFSGDAYTPRLKIEQALTAIGSKEEVK